MGDNLDAVWNRFLRARTKPLHERFPGFYRAEVVETNDPLQHHRVRFKCPELHDHNLRPDQCPWADKSPALGGKNVGSWEHPCIGDIVWVTWEKNHPYGPIWVGFASGTRRKRYPLESIYTESPLAVKLDGTADEKPADFLTDYLPKDRRPMATGWRDRYGNAEVNSAVGFFPVEHRKKPAPPGQDPVSNKAFESGSPPEVNKPDRKYLARITKYGTYCIQSDVGYYWQRPEQEENESEEGGEDQQLGEFYGDFDKDRPFEIERYFYFNRLFNEDKPEETDQRRFEIRTRAGHKFEMRDVGWAQMGGGRSGCDDAGKTKSRPGEYDEPRVLSKTDDTDERWIKWRTKGGHLIQMMDMGFHPEDDNFYKKLLNEEVGTKADQEQEAQWNKRDARQIRILTRWGTKFVLDDRGTDPEKAEEKEKPRANGWMLKGRRSWETDEGTSRGFTIEANEKDELNTTRWYTPKSKLIEMNDRKDYMMLCTDTASEISREWMGFKENEFARKIAMTEDPEKDTYHLKLDKANGYLRLKTAAGGDNGRRQEPELFDNADTGLNQGLEARDGRFGSDGPWTELVDMEHRGLWLSKQHKLGIWRSKEEKDQYILIHDGNNTIVLRNNEDGPLQIFCKNDVQIISERNIAMKAAQRITFKAGQEIAFEAANSGHAKLTGSAWAMNVPDRAPEHTGRLPGAQAGGGAQSNTGQSAQVINPKVITQDKKEPEDRGEVLNSPFDEVEEEVIRVCKSEKESEE